MPDYITFLHHIGNRDGARFWPAYLAPKRGQSIPPH